MPGQRGYDPDWDSPEAIAKHIVRGIYNVPRRAEAYHREKARLEAEDEAFRIGTARPLNARTKSKPPWTN
ncbi:hypothetical protein QO002_005904 [Pararhizobium capsulatum DSM 1112]|uniref:Uncharacterized protein n=1 Tax=Pararhizobium capsulatum DSM 1112 TaxID=1121113 RepID=A0ABU0BZK7_9HYPH|nr:hypothetical protein [Pararhizobium capsulatum]MDQ0323697.1 hypothetical protein [Pararhizobium capsulatum DSM 1112]